MRLIKSSLHNKMMMPFFKFLSVSAFLYVLSAYTVTLAGEEQLKENVIEQIVIQIHQQTLQGGYKLMSVARLKQLVDNKEKFVLIDAQPVSHYKKGFIDGAKNFEFKGNFSGKWKNDAVGSQADFKALLGDDLDKTIILSCGGLQCKRSHTAASWSKKIGYKAVYRVPSGIQGWRDAGYPIKTHQ